MITELISGIYIGNMNDSLDKNIYTSRKKVKSNLAEEQKNMVVVFKIELVCGKRH